MLYIDDITSQIKLAEITVKKAKENKLKISTAESCTGGSIAAAITDVSGSSAVFDGGVVTYANNMKNKLIGVENDILDKYGAVSYQTAAQMSNGVLLLTESDISVSVTGIAGPTGGTTEKPIGLVYISISSKSDIASSIKYEFIMNDIEILKERGMILYNSIQLIDQNISSQYSQYDTIVFQCVFSGDRSIVRKSTVNTALLLVLNAIINNRNDIIVDS